MNFSAIEYALGEIGGDAKAAEPVLEGELASKDDNVRLIGAWALAKNRRQFRDVAAKDVPVLIAGLSLDDPQESAGRGGAGLLRTAGKGRRRGPAKGVARPRQERRRGCRHGVESVKKMPPARRRSGKTRGRALQGGRKGRHGRR